MYYGGESNVPGAPGNLFAGGIPLRQFFPNAPSDIPFTPGAPGAIRPGSKQKLKDIFPNVPGGYGGEDGGPRYGTTPGGVAGNPFGPQFEIPGRNPVGQPVLPGEDKKAIEDVYGIPGPRPMPGTAPLGLPMAFGSSNLPGAVGNMGGIANAQFFEGPQLGQATPQGEPGKPYGGAPNVPLTPEEKARLLQQGSPIPPNFREQYLPKTGVDLAGNQGPSTPVKFDEHMNMFVPNMGGGRPGKVRLKIPQAEFPAGFQAKYVS